MVTCWLSVEGKGGGGLRRREKVCVALRYDCNRSREGMRWFELHRRREEGWINSAGMEKNKVCVELRYSMRMDELSGDCNRSREGM